MRHLYCAALAAALLGCATTTPIVDVIDAPAVAGSGRPLTRADVEAAIERGSRHLGWRINPDGPGVLTARLFLRSHVAEVEIEHDTDSYSIRYRDSSNLDAGNGEIHAAYNRWVQNLHRSIRDELEQL